ncbi:MULTISPECIES: hypothetical protein [Priestia]|uniref:hypothetical protein n=1 Tax=Priestia TaxID=2800373 RepID=UPI0021F40637|nr:hypothetical protein [Priestia megaterium]UYP07468.1 hypothetical protein OIJ04_25620 [Priestia megaterium]
MKVLKNSITKIITFSLIIGLILAFLFTIKSLLLQFLGAALLFGALAVVVAGVTIFNIYLNHNISNTTASKQIQVTNDSLQEENKELKKQLSEVRPSAQEQQKRVYLNTVHQFIDVSYHREKDGFEERKKIAKSIMDKELYE